MPSQSDVVESELKPQVRWTQVTDAPLVGMGFAREAGLLLTWDQSNNVSLWDLAGTRRQQIRTPVAILQAAISDDGSQVVVVDREATVWWLEPTLQPRVNHPGPRPFLGMAIEPYGQFLAVSAGDSHTILFDRSGRRLVNFATNRPLKFLSFLSARAALLGAAEYGLLACFEPDGQPRWQDNLWSSVGHLTTSGEGLCILLSCFTHGVQRYGLDGSNEGAYHLGTGVHRVALDYDGRVFAAASMEGELFLVNAPGNILWRQTLERAAKEIALDAAGRILIYGTESGELTLLDLYASPKALRAAAPRAGAKTPTAPSMAGVAAPGAPIPLQPATSATGDGRRPAPPKPSSPIREPAWSVKAFDHEEQAETCVVAVLESPFRIAVFSSRRRPELYDEQGQLVCKGDSFGGVGRYLEADATLLVVLTDREAGVYDPEANCFNRFYSRFVQVSHVRPDSVQAQLVVVEEQDRLSRYDLAGERRWTVTLDNAVEALAIMPGGQTAVTTENGHLRIYELDKRLIGQFQTTRPEPLALAVLGKRWITLAGRSQLVRGHQIDGRVEWETRLPEEAWRLYRIGRAVAARAAGGRTWLLSAEGRMLLDSSELPHEATLFAAADGSGSAAFWRSGNLMVTDLNGQVRWRYLSNEPPGPIAVSPLGIACVLGRQLAWFPMG